MMQYQLLGFVMCGKCKEIYKKNLSACPKCGSSIVHSDDHKRVEEKARRLSEEVSGLKDRFSELQDENRDLKAELHSVRLVVDADVVRIKDLVEKSSWLSAERDRARAELEEQKLLLAQYLAKEDTSVESVLDDLAKNVATVKPKVEVVALKETKVGMKKPVDDVAKAKENLRKLIKPKLEKLVVVDVPTPADEVFGVNENMEDYELEEFPDIPPLKPEMYGLSEEDLDETSDLDSEIMQIRKEMKELSK